MNCREVQDRIDGFVRDELDAATAAAVSTHLAGCAECRAEAELARMLAGELRGLKTRAPESLRVRVTGSMPRRRFSWVIPARALAALLLLSAVIWFTSEGRRVYEPTRLEKPAEIMSEEPTDALAGPGPSSNMKRFPAVENAEPPATLAPPPGAPQERVSEKPYDGTPKTPDVPRVVVRSVEPAPLESYDGVRYGDPSLAEDESASSGSRPVPADEFSGKTAPFRNRSEPARGAGSAIDARADTTPGSSAYKDSSPR